VKIVREDRIELEFDTTGSAKGKPGFKVIEDKKTAPERPGGECHFEMERPAELPVCNQKYSFYPGAGSTTNAVFYNTAL